LATIENRATDFCVVVVTCPSDDEADRIAERLVAEQLAACVQALPIKSRYVWKGETKRVSEVLMLVETRRALVAEIDRLMNTISGYDLPELVALSIVDASDQYLAWIAENTVEDVTK
jgi:periplasmic divalent cation tolerance protein